MTGPHLYKTCTNCREFKAITEFYVRSNGRREARCKPCIIAANNGPKAERRRIAREARAALPPPVSKVCSQCGIEKAMSAFYRRYAECRDCNKIRRDAAYADPDRRARANATVYQYDQKNVLKRRAYNMGKYGLTPEKYDEMFDTQGGRCFICRVEGERVGLGQVARAKVLCIDHDHETGAVRALLCQTCNRGIGLFGDNIERLEAAISYLKLHSQEAAHG